LETEVGEGNLAGVEASLGMKDLHRLTAEVREKIRVRHMAYRTEQVHPQWIRRYIAFHNRRDPPGSRRGRG
jgi:hypothetical protein